MPLPTRESLEWPPGNGRGLQKDFREWSAWYSGDTAALATVYGANLQGGPYNTEPRPSQTSLIERLRFWGRRGVNAPANRVRIHVPAAADVAATSADLLFGDEPKIVLPTTGSSNTPNPTQERFDQLADQMGFYNVLLEGAEVCAALGGAYLRTNWDREVADHPLLDVIHADVALPEWRGDKLWAVTFWNVLQVDGQLVYRKLERHERGAIFTGLYAGTPDQLGKRVPLTELDETKDLVEDVVLPTELSKTLLVDYVPNVRPHRKYRTQPQGRSDFSGSEGLMDALDETYTSWMRDIRLGQARLVISEDALNRGGRGQGATFDGDQELFTRIQTEPGQNTTGLPIEAVQFEIRTEQHMATALNLFERIVTTAGYAPQTFGMNIDGNAPSGTALRVREGKTLKTRQRKARYWVPAIAAQVEKLLLVDRYVLERRDVEPAQPTIALSDVVVNDPVETAQSISLLRQAQAASRRTAVKMAQPDLSDEKVEEEVKLIEAENSVAFDPTGGFP